MVNEMNDDLDFEQHIKGFSHSEQFLARQLRDVQIEAKKIADISHASPCLPTINRIEGNDREMKDLNKRIEDLSSQRQSSMSKKEKAGLWGAIIGGMALIVEKVLTVFIKP